MKIMCYAISLVLETGIIWVGFLLVFIAEHVISCMPLFQPAPDVLFKALMNMLTESKLFYLHQYEKLDKQTR